MWARGSEAYSDNAEPRRNGAVMTLVPPEIPGVSEQSKPKKIKKPKSSVGREHILYRMFDSESRLLYIGITMNIRHRVAAHRSTKEWWTNVAVIKVERLPTRAAALEAERNAIALEKPAHNVSLNGLLNMPTTKPEKPKKRKKAKKVKPVPWFLRPRPPGR